MKCPKCQFDNREGAAFCLKCGEKLELKCPQCGKALPPLANFCDGCGHNLTLPSESASKVLSPEEKVEKIQKYLPKGIAEKILAHRDRIEGERKQITVMFCDMEGFTGLSEKIDPEEVYSIMDQVYEILIHKVRDYEGTVNEMTGDGIMALFGAPIALEDASQRAIRSALAIHREISRFNDRMKQEKPGLPQLKMRVGIHTGPVVVGALGNDLRVEFKAVGDTVNLASRMENMADPGTTFVTEDTFNLTEGFFRFEGLGERQIKGKEKPVNIYRVIAPSTRRTRFDVSAERGLTRFVGRERELEIMLDCLERARMGRGQAISIVAEAGIGKSRLLYEFRKAIANEDVTFFEGRCLSYSRNVPFHPIIDLLKSNFNIQEDDTDDTIKEKVKKGLAIVNADEASTLPYLLEVLSVKESGINQIMMSPEARKDRISGALKQIVLKGAALRPLLLAIEDLYWVDNSSVDVLKDLLDDIGGVAVFLIFTYRPTSILTWGAKSYHNQVILNRLSNRESLTMVDSILETNNIHSDLEELILEKTEGVPFYIEEFIRTLKDLKVIEKRDNQYTIVKDVKEISIPSTIHDVIMSRVDALPQGAKEVLQAGSAIEREFSYDMIQKVTELPERELLSSMSVLKDAELLFERGIYPDSSFIFKHALTRDVVYDSLFAKRKKKLHEEIGNTIEELYKENIDEHYGVLAEHFIISQNYEKGAKHFRLAGRKAEKTASLNDAIAYTGQAIGAFEKLPQTDNICKQIIDARTVLGLYMFQLFYFVAAKEAIDPIFEIAINIGYKKKVSQIYTILGAYSQWIEEDFSKAFKYLEEALETSMEIGDIVAQFFANQWLGFAWFHNCDFKKAISHFQKALDINVATKTVWGISVVKSCLSQVYNHQGMIREGYEASESALSIAEKSGDIYSKAIAYTYHGLSNYSKGNWEEAEKYLLKAISLNEKINFFVCNAHAHYFLGTNFFEIGAYEKAEAHYKEAIRLLENIQCLPSRANVLKICLALSRVMKNGGDIDLEVLYAYVDANNLKVYDGCMRRYIGEILLNIDDQHLSEAEIWINKAINVDSRNSMKWHLAEDYTLYADLMKRKGYRPKAKENLIKAIKIYQECGAAGWVDKTKKELETLL